VLQIGYIAGGFGLFNCFWRRMMSIDVGKGYVQVTEGLTQRGDELNNSQQKGDWCVCNIVGIDVNEYCENGRYIVRRKATMPEPVQQIPGVPEGWRVVRVGRPQSHETIAGHSGPESGEGLSRCYAIIERIEPEKPKTRKVVLRKYVVGITDGSQIVWTDYRPTDSLYNFVHDTGVMEEIEIPVQ
jgi:hypothetical protein